MTPEIEAAVDAYGTALRASVAAFRRYSAACVAREDMLANVLDLERNLRNVEAQEALASLDRLLEGGRVTGVVRDTVPACADCGVWSRWHAHCTAEQLDVGSSGCIDA